MQNEGKKFENAIKKSIPDYCFYYRLKDSTGTFSGGSNLRFSSNNPCDCFVFNDNNCNLYALELKTTKNGNYTFWREDFENVTKKQTFMIKKNQIIDLTKMSRHKMICGFLLNFRDTTDNTYFIDIMKFNTMIYEISKKSFNEKDLLKYNPYSIKGIKKRINYLWDMETFFNEIFI